MMVICPSITKASPPLFAQHPPFVALRQAAELSSALHSSIRRSIGAKVRFLYFLDFIYKATLINKRID
jgi:hypothetical protein